MSQGLAVAELSGVDEARFGIRTARAREVTHEQIPELMAFCRSQAVRMLIARCPTTDLRAAQAMEGEGALLMDTLVYYARDLRKAAAGTGASPARVRHAAPADAAEVERIAAETFRGYSGHYHADERLDREKCDETYRSWAVRSVSTPGVADAVLVAEENARLLGFATLRMNTPDEGEGVLFGVAPEAQGRGIYRLFMECALEWCREQGARSMVVSTQITNLAVQRVWVRLGFEPSRSFYTFHKWFD
jgi:GNAT superfamily N-acetyltransferase